jgi:lysophospholipase L1-like esterase
LNLTGYGWQERTQKRNDKEKTWLRNACSLQLFTLRKNDMKSFFGLSRIVLVVSLVVGAKAQQAAQAPTPSPQLVPTPGIPPTGFAGLDGYRARRIAVFTDDYGQLSRYREGDEKLAPPAAGENRVVFFGDSITDIWHLDQYFPGKPYVNRGIGGQTTPQMLVRFRQDVIDLHPKVVVILAGTNDIAGNTGPMRDDDIEANYKSFYELARASGVRVVYASVLPVHNYTEKSKDFFAQRPTARILALNEWLKKYCADNHIVYLDYFSSLLDDKGLLKKDLADDGLHPNDAGFKIMAPLAEAAIAKALK